MSTIKNSVVLDDFCAARLAVKHLIVLGHQRIAYVNGQEGWHSARGSGALSLCWAWRC